MIRSGISRNSSHVLKCTADVLIIQHEQHVYKGLRPDAQSTTKSQFEHELTCYQVFERQAFCVSAQLMLPQQLRVDLAEMAEMWCRDYPVLLLPLLQPLAQRNPPVRDIAAILQTVGQLHDLGWIHGDLKRTHFGWQGSDLKLLDFGLVQHQHEGRSDCVNLWQNHEHLGRGNNDHAGTPAYWSPQRFLGERIQQSDDLYALGILLFELLTGEKPYHATSYAGWARQHCQQDIPWLPADNRPFQPLIDGLLAKYPANRLTSCFEALKMLAVITASHDHAMITSMAKN